MPSNAVHLPDELVALVDRAMAAKGGYTSRAEFVRECIRRCSHAILEESGEQNKKKRKGRWP
tara:strand:+ start:1766 stop:1951 length:186 start_codon:yes stop_codon:yes gene_type:complete